MPLNAELLMVALIVGTALAFIGRRFWRAVRSARVKGGAGCASGCGCDTAGAPRVQDWAER